MNRKPRMTPEEHMALGTMLKAIDGFLVREGDAVGNVFPQHSPGGDAARSMLAARGTLQKARSRLEAQLCQDHPEWARQTDPTLPDGHGDNQGLNVYYGSFDRDGKLVVVSTGLATEPEETP